MEIGAALWGMQSTRMAPKHTANLYADLVEDCQLAEGLGFPSLWLTEHRFWYDGYCPSLMTAAGLTAAATTRLRIGTGCLLLPQHDPLRVAEGAAVVDALSGGRLDLGVANGYREAEFDGLGVSRTRRASRMEEALDVFSAAWGDGPVEHEGRNFRVSGVEVTPKPVQRPIPVWIGAVTEAPVERAAKRGLNIMLSDAHSPERARELIALYHRVADESGVDASNVKFGILHYLWVDETTERARAEAIPWLRALLLEQLGGWRYLSDAEGKPVGFERPDDLRAAAEMVIGHATVGGPDDAIRNLRRYRDAGVNFVVGRTHLLVQSREQLHRSMRLIATEVAPALG